MKSFYVGSDVHIGAIRSGGTTVRSASALRVYLLERFQKLLDIADGPLLLNGDLLDSYSIPYTDLLQTFLMLQKWLEKGHKLYLTVGNHDISRTVATLSSFQFLGKLLTQNPAVTFIDQPTLLAEHSLYVVPHLQNQEQFEIALSKVPSVDFLALHCNYNNFFAQESDSSLNLSPEQAAALPVKTIIFGHEHQRRSELNGKVQVVGNQFSSSVADCLNNTHKYMLKVHDSGQLEFIETWTASEEFERIDWRNAMKAKPGTKFIRVEGECAEHEAASMISAIAKLRQAHEAFVITNAVKIAGAADAAENSRMSLEEIKGFDVLTALLKKLTEPQRAVVNAIMEKIDVSGN